MIKFGYFAAHEQHTPNQLVEYALLSERLGFDSVWSSDHFHPWAHTGASSGFAWSWLGSVAALTKKVKLGTGVTAPTLRYHPAIVAQCFATLGYMYPGRIFLGLGTGEAMNESPLGFGWPSYSERLQRLEEAIHIILSLWREDWVNFRGRYYKLENANLYTKPSLPIPIYVAACGPKAAFVAGKYADGMINLPMSTHMYIDKLFPAMRRGAAQSGRDPESLEKIIELEVSYDEDYEKALKSCRFWAGTKVPNCIDIADPREIEARGREIPDEVLTESWFVFTTEEEIIKLIEEYSKLGFSHIVFLSSSPSENKFIQLMGTKVLPYVKDRFNR